MLENLIRYLYKQAAEFGDLANKLGYPSVYLQQEVVLESEIILEPEKIRETEYGIKT